MKKVKINKIDFSEIFHYATKKYGIQWNPCNDMFFNNSLDYKSFNEYDLGEPLENIEDKPYEELSFEDKGYYIINQFMIDNEIKNIFIDNR